MAKSKPNKQPIAGESSFQDWELWVIESTLRAVDWNISAAARCLEVGRSTLHRKIKRFRIKLPRVPKS